MPDLSTEARIRAELRAGADGEPFAPVAAPVARRARRRLVRNTVVAWVLGIAVLAGALAGLRALTDPATTTPGRGSTYVPPANQPCCLPPTASLVYAATDDTVRWIDPAGGSGIVFHSADAVAVGRDGSIVEMTPDRYLEIYTGGHGYIPVQRPGAVTGAAIRPDGTQVAYTTERGLFVSRVPTTGVMYPPRLVVSTRAGEGFSSPTWSPDGGRLAFVRTQGADSSLAMYDVVTRHASLWREGVSSAAWSPVEDAIAALGPHGEGLMLIDGSTSATQTIDPAAASTTAPAWSPDGSRIAFLGPGGAATIVRPDGSPAGRVVLPDLAPDTPLLWSFGVQGP
jgi:hypothetical protein